MSQEVGLKIQLGKRLHQPEVLRFQISQINRFYRPVLVAAAQIADKPHAVDEVFIPGLIPTADELETNEEHASDERYAHGLLLPTSEVRLQLTDRSAVVTKNEAFFLVGGHVGWSFTGALEAVSLMR